MENSTKLNANFASTVVTGIAIAFAVLAAMSVIGFSITRAFMEADFSFSSVEAVVAIGTAVNIGITALLIRAGLKNSMRQTLAYGAIGSLILGVMVSAVTLF